MLHVFFNCHVLILAILRTFTEIRFNVKMYCHSPVAF